MIVMYSKDGCSFCVKAKKYLKSKNINFREINVEHDSKALAFLKSRNHRTVPQFYYDDYLAHKQQIFVEGGCDGLLSLSEEELDAKLAKVSVLG